MFDRFFFGKGLDFFFVVLGGKIKSGLEFFRRIRFKNRLR